MKQLGYRPKLSQIGAYLLLTFGFMLQDYTLIEGIKRIPPGSILSYSQEEILINRYYQVKSTPYVNDSEEEIIQNIDLLFSEAIRLEYTKDLEYGYQHIATLSGGLDSRMNIIKAKDGI